MFNACFPTFYKIYDTLFMLTSLLFEAAYI